MDKYIEKCIRICSDIEYCKETIKCENKILTGYSGKKLCTALQLFTKELVGKNDIYLEIGVFQGLTLLSNANFNKNAMCIGIDNFSLFNKDGNNKKIVEERINKLDINNVKLIDMDFDDALDNFENLLKGKKVGVFFIDGAHDYRSQLISLLKIKRFLSDECVIIIDDANYAHVRQATKDFLASESDFKMICQAYTKAHPANLSSNEKKIAIDGWWNGVNILVKDKNNDLQNINPKVSRENRDQHFFNHDIMRTRYTEVLIKILNLSIEYKEKEDNDKLRKIDKILKEHKSKTKSRYESHNTYSENLKEFELHNL